ncbi:MAG TPA: helix-turn-helix domain-containing protein [Allosphingosinicella sp.]|jgi:putative transcriptional regulator|nr:helix-turn-helix domain-containing protein [Allosphingosinicella sp.]
MAAGSKILEGLTEALAHARGESTDARQVEVRIPDMVDVKAVRQSLGLTQSEFALRFGFKLDTVRNWEQAKRVPEASARALLTIIGAEPEAVRRALAM